MKWQTHSCRKFCTDSSLCIGSERRRVADWSGWGLPGVASRVTVGARVSICFGGSYSTLSGPPQIGLGGERVAGGGGGGRRTIVLRYRSPWLFRKPYQSLSWLPAAAAHPSYRRPRLWTMRSLPVSSRSPLTFVTTPNNGIWSHQHGDRVYARKCVVEICRSYE